MATVHVTQYFSTTSPAVFDECDRLMDTLVDLEDQDPRVRDASVAADSALGMVEVQVVADGGTQQAATDAALARIHDAVSSVVTAQGAPLLERGHPLTAAACV